MAKRIYALNQSLDGYVDHQKFTPDPTLFHRFTDDIRTLSGLLYGRRMYQTMRYRDNDRPDWESHEPTFAAAWRSQPT